MALLGTPPTADVTPYVPRLALEWDLEAAGASWRTVEGTLVFLDISGFTKMSERLSRFGLLGAEEVTDTLNHTFSRLLDIAYAHGGGLLKFGGDALLIFFSGPNHAALAASAAWQMRADLRAAGRIETAAGYVTLRMSVGIHTGEFHFFLVGTSHRELVVAGPGATATVLMEHDADAGDILLSAECAAALGSLARGAAKGAGYLLRRLPTVVAADQNIARRSTDRESAMFLPTAIRAHVAGGGHEAEHRQATVAFVHFHGTDELLAARGLDALAADFHTLVEHVSSIADRYELGFIGTDVDLNGGKFILTAGAPIALGSPDEAMLRALREVLAAPPPIGLSAGVHRGHVFAGDVGPAYRRTYTVMGDVVNTAARIMARAETGQILASPEVVDHCAAEFDTTAIEPFRGKGKKAALRASIVGELLGSRATAAADLPLVGRRRELGALVSWLEDARVGRGAVIEVVGPPGMGKTRLLDEFRAASRGTQWYVTLCEQYQQTTPYFVIRTLLRRLIGAEPDTPLDAVEALLRSRVAAISPELEPWLPLLGLPLDLNLESTTQVDLLDPSRRRAKTHEVLSDFLAKAIVGPAVWVVDDAYWLDTASADAIRHILASISKRAWLVCLARWPDTPALGAGVATAEVVLDPLDAQESLELTRAAAPDALLPDDARAITERAGGSPLFLQELARAASAGAGAESLPGTVEALVASRIDALAPADRLLLRSASVIGRRGSVAVLQRLVGGGRAIPAAAFRRTAPLLSRDGDDFRFQHGVVHEVTYSRIPFRRRRELHERVGILLEADQSGPEALSHHFHEAQAFDRAWDYARSAATRAQEKYAYAEASAFWRRSLDSARHLADVASADIAEAWEALGFALTRSGHLLEATSAYAAARRLAIDPVRLARLCLLDGEIRRLTGESTSAMRWFNRGLRAVDGLGGAPAAKERVRLTLGCAWVDFQRGRYLDAMRIAGALGSTLNAPGMSEAWATR